MLQHVGQGLLDDPVDGQPRRARDVEGSPGALDGDGQARAADALGQGVELAQPGLGRQRRLLGTVGSGDGTAAQPALAGGLLPEQAEHAAHVGQRLAPRARHVMDGLAGARGVRGLGGDGGVGQGHHHLDVV